MTDPDPRPTLIIYRSAGCHLCDDAEILLRDELAMRARAGLPAVHVERVDIASDPALEARYRRRIPVLAIGEEERDLVTNASQLRELLERALPTST